MYSFRMEPRSQAVLDDKTLAWQTHRLQELEVAPRSTDYRKVLATRVDSHFGSLE